jgi:hypothetical protein
MTGWVFWMSWSTGREVVEPGYPGWIWVGARVVIGVTRADRCDRAPEDVTIFSSQQAIPASAMATFINANKWAFSESLKDRAAEICEAIRFQ